MSRISIDVTPEEHRKLKAIAALKGKTMKDYLLGGRSPPTATIRRRLWQNWKRCSMSESPITIKVH